jgi:riboflavin synthase
MFTGLIEEVGSVTALGASKNGYQLKIAAPRIAKKIQRGASLAVNGCCLTVSSRRGGALVFDLLDETIARTNLKHLRQKQPVNLERAVAASKRFGGHFVQGHIDCVSPVRRAAPIFDWKSSYPSHSPITSPARVRLRSMESVLP